MILSLPSAQSPYHRHRPLPPVLPLHPSLLQTVQGTIVPRAVTLPKRLRRGHPHRRLDPMLPLGLLHHGAAITHTEWTLPPGGMRTPVIQLRCGSVTHTMNKKGPLRSTKDFTSSPTRAASNIPALLAQPWSIIPERSVVVDLNTLTLLSMLLRESDRARLVTLGTFQLLVLAIFITHSRDMVLTGSRVTLFTFTVQSHRHTQSPWPILIPAPLHYPKDRHCLMPHHRPRAASLELLILPAMDSLRPC